MVTGRWIPGVALLALFVAGAAFAQEPPLTPEQVTTGEVRLSMSSDYARLRVDGEEWENHEFLDNGRTVVIHALDRTEEHVVSLTPIYPDLAPFELRIAPSDWKLATVGKLLKMWRVEQRIVFKKVPPAAKPVTPPPAEPDSQD